MSTVKHTMARSTASCVGGLATHPTVTIHSDGPNEKISSLNIPICENKRGPHGHLEDILTEDDFRSQGLASKIINEAIAYAREMGLYKLLITCSPNLIRFYKPFGFVLMADDPDGFESFLYDNPFGIKEITMRFDL